MGLFSSNETAKRGAPVEPISQDDHRQWQHASAPEVPQSASQWRPSTNPDWRPSPGIEAMNRMYPDSLPLTREQPSPEPIPVTAQQMRAIKVAMFGRRLWMTPSMKRHLAELFVIADPQQYQPLPTPKKPVKGMKTFFT